MNSKNQLKIETSVIELRNLILESDSIIGADHKHNSFRAKTLSLPILQPVENTLGCIPGNTKISYSEVSEVFVQYGFACKRPISITPKIRN